MELEASASSGTRAGLHVNTPDGPEATAAEQVLLGQDCIQIATDGSGLDTLYYLYPGR